MDVKHARVALALVFVALTFVAVRWATPSDAVPTEFPALLLEGSESRAAIEADRALANGALDDALARQRRDLYRAANLAERRPERPEERETRRTRMTEVVTAIREAHGDTALAAMRAADVERMIPALAARDDEARAAEIGAFVDALERWGATVGGRRIASELVVRALFAARWNVTHDLLPTAGFDALRERAYFGWLALHGDAADDATRATALDAYQRAGGPNAEEARGVLAWRAGAYLAAAAHFGAAYEEEGNVRLRNHQRAAIARAAIE